MNHTLTSLLARIKPLLVRCLLPFWLIPGLASATNPLQPIDTSSPRATLQGFIATMDEGYEMGYGRVRAYLESSRLFLSDEDFSLMRQSLARLNMAERVIDFSAIPVATARESSRRLTLQLKEVLDRIELPPCDAIPDAEAMSKTEFKRWIIPGSELRIVRMETGPRAGEYLFFRRDRQSLAGFP